MSYLSSMGLEPISFFLVRRDLYQTRIDSTNDVKTTLLVDLGNPLLPEDKKKIFQVRLERLNLDLQGKEQELEVILQELRVQVSKQLATGFWHLKQYELFELLRVLNNCHGTD